MFTQLPVSKKCSLQHVWVYMLGGELGCGAGDVLLQQPNPDFSSVNHHLSPRLLHRHPISIPLTKLADTKHRNKRLPLHSVEEPRCAATFRAVFRRRLHAPSSAFFVAFITLPLHIKLPQTRFSTVNISPKKHIISCCIEWGSSTMSR